MSWYGLQTLIPRAFGMRRTHEARDPRSLRSDARLPQVTTRSMATVEGSL